MKQTFEWFSNRVERQVRLVRWGHFGTPVLLFPTAGGDAEECERFLMIRALGPLIEGGRVKVYSVDSVAGEAWLSGKHSPAYCSRLQTLFDATIYHEIVPAIRRDCNLPPDAAAPTDSRRDGLGILTAGASIGAFNALATLCRHPDAFTRAICMSGTYDLAHWLDGTWNDDFYFSSPLHFLPGLGESEQLRLLRQRFVVLPTGEGRWEDPGQSWRVAEVLGAKRIPNRVDPWGPEHDHDWPTWRAMLPRYLAELA